MGALPSRSIVEEKLTRVPPFKAEQDIVLIPLIKKYFSSPDSKEFRQFYQSRLDPAVRYYHCYNDRITNDVTLVKSNANDNTCAKNTLKNDNQCETRVDRSIYCSLPMEFPEDVIGIEEMYKQYVEKVEECLFTDNTELQQLTQSTMAYKYIQPIPCAVAFGYELNKDENDILVMDNKYVKIVGFVGFVDVEKGVRVKTMAELFLKEKGVITDKEELEAMESVTREFDLYLTKSAGDHNRILAFMAALYTYFAQ